MRYDLAGRDHAGNFIELAAGGKEERTAAASGNGVHARQFAALVRSRAQGRAGGERARPHAQARSDRRRYGLQHTAAGRTKFQTGVGSGKMSAQPVSASGAFLIDALHGPTRQVLHCASPSGDRARSAARSSKMRGLLREPTVVSRKNATRYRGRVAEAVDFSEFFGGAKVARDAYAASLCEESSARAEVKQDGRKRSPDGIHSARSQL